MRQTADNTQRREAILAAAIDVFARFGFKKTSVDDIAEAAGLSKQGLYLHFASKEDVFVAGLRKFLDDGMAQVERELNKRGASLAQRLSGALDAWYGRFFVLSTPHLMDIFEAGRRLNADLGEKHKIAFRALLAKTIADSAEFKRTKNVCTPKEIALLLYQFGSAWKEHASRAEFQKHIAICVRACCQVES